MERVSKKWDILNKITSSGLVVVVRAENATVAKKIMEACLEGGAPAIEITYTVPGATRVIEELAKVYTPDQIMIGAGTVLDQETARISILAGAQYVVSPYLDPATIKLCNRYQVPCMPGVMTIEGVIQAMELGADILKVFPGEAFGSQIIKSIKGPLPQVILCRRVALASTMSRGGSRLGQLPSAWGAALRRAQRREITQVSPAWRRPLSPASMRLGKKFVYG
ncbi:KHG/KDPG aldolase [Peptococcaceae bacterium CEB3]|nr:KHG/KDPG aldolase [Peptococcaceae bacterium CEB3]